MKMDDLSHLQIDALQEIGNIAAGNAATSLSVLTEKQFHISVSEVILVPFSKVLTMLENPDEPVVSIHFQILGEASGTVYFILPINEAKRLAERLTGKTSPDIMDSLLANNSKEDHQLLTSSLIEAGNILVGTYLSALSEFTSIHMQPSLPSLNVDMAGAILSIGLVEISEAMDQAMLVNTSIHGETFDERISGKFFMIPHEESVSKIFQALGLSDAE